MTFDKMVTKEPPQLIVLLQQNAPREVPNAQTSSRHAQTRGLSLAVTVSSKTPLAVDGDWPRTARLHKRGTPFLVRIDPCQTEFPVTLVQWAERRVLREQEESATKRFDAAMETFVFSLRDTHLDCVPNRMPHAQRRKANGSAVNPKLLLHKVCQVICCFRICCAHDADNSVPLQLPATAFYGLRSLARSKLIVYEEQALLELDSLLLMGFRDMELHIWVCLWVMILEYRKLISMYPALSRRGVAGSMTVCEDGKQAWSPST